MENLQCTKGYDGCTLTCVIQIVTVVVHVVLIVPADCVTCVQVIIAPSQVDGIICAVAGILGQREGAAVMSIAVVAVHAA